jgi:hypothetical protein
LSDAEWEAQQAAQQGRNAAQQGMKAKNLAMASCDCCFGLKEEFQELKQTLDSVVVDLRTLKMCLVGVLIGVVFACMWK